VRAGSIRDTLTHAVSGPLWLLVGAAGLVLLVACVNVSNLLLARAESRRDQAALRRALGADRIRIARGHLAESLVLVGTGGILGLLIGRLTLPLLIRLAPEGTPRLAEVSFDGRVVGAMAAAVAATALLSGLVPAWRASRAAPAGLASHGRRTVGGGTAILDGFVSGQIALSAALAVGALLLGASFLRLLEIDRGFSHERAVVVPLALSADVRRQGALVAYQRILDEARALPGVVGAHLAYHAPDEGRGINLRLIRPEGLREEAIGEGSIIAVTPGYFETLEIDVLDGRAFRRSDDELGAPVAVVSASFARRLVPTDVDAVGWRFTHAAGPGGDTVELEIVGVVADVVPDPSEAPPPILYVPFDQLPFGYQELIVKTSGPPAAILPLLRERIWNVDPRVPLDAARTLEEAVSRSVASPRFYMLVVGAFAALAVLLAAIGTYSVAAYGVSRREREIGVRAALGADTRRIVTQVFGARLRPVGIGIGVGLASAAALSRVLSGLLFGVTPLEPWVYLAVTAWLAVVALAAVAVPALRAARTDPLRALRSD
jgi:putative ABC transport system permease protein